MRCLVLFLEPLPPTPHPTHPGNHVPLMNPSITWPNVPDCTLCSCVRVTCIPLYDLRWATPVVFGAAAFPPALTVYVQCLCTFSTLLCFFLNFSSLIRRTCTSALQSAHSVLSSFLCVCFDVLLCPSHLATMCHEQAWLTFPECCNFVWEECQEFCVWCWGGTYRGPKAFRHTYTHIAKHIETTVVWTFNRAYVKVDSLERFLSC